VRPLDLPALAIFDMIGTTVAGSDAVGDLFEATLAESGVAVERAAIAAVRGLNKRDAFRSLAADTTPDAADVDRLSAAWLTSFRRTLIDRFAAAPAREIPGTTATFEWLRGRGVVIALCSGLDREIVTDLVARLGWTPALVSHVVSGDDVERGRPAPDLILEVMRRAGVSDRARVLVAGDTPADLEAAHAAGIDAAVGVLSGAGTRETLGRQPHALILESVAALVDVVH
jgi:phosphonatase-like hydrolase